MRRAALGAKDLRGLRPRKNQIAYRRFATFPPGGTDSPSRTMERFWVHGTPKSFQKALASPGSARS